jgi:superfamily II DNA or RNA helicase
VLPTGAGKTILAAMDTVQADAKKILFIVHSRDINLQARDEFAKVRGIDEKYGFLNGYEKDFDADILFANIQSLSRPDNFARLIDREFDYVIVDEAHHVGAKSYESTISKLKTKYLLGITATPIREDGKDVPAFFGKNIVYQMKVKEAIEKELLVPFGYFGIHDNVDYSKLKWNGYKYGENDLNKALIIEDRDRKIIAKFKEMCGVRQTIGFCVSIKHCYSMAEKFNNAGIPSVAVTSETSKELREQYKADFKKGKYQVIFAKDVFNEGIDFPNIQAELFLRPTWSERVFWQQLGRGLRRAPGKANVLVLDFIGNYKGANKIREYFKRQGFEISEPGRMKPEYHYEVEVVFEAKVVDIFQGQESVILKTDQELLDDLKRLYRQHGRVTSAKVLRYGIISPSVYRKRFGSFNEAMILAGLTVNNRRYSKEELLEDMKNIANKLGRAPTTPEYDKLGIASGAIMVNAFGTWNKAVKASGLNPVREYATREGIKNDVRNCIEKLGRVPTLSEYVEIGKWSRQTMTPYWKSFGTLIRELGYEPIKNQRIEADLLKQDLLEVYKKLGRPPSVKEYLKHGKFSRKGFYRIFGSWSDALKSIETTS